MNLLKGILIGAIVIFVPGVANATTGYVCGFSRAVFTGTRGSSGSVSVTYHTAPYCGGVLQASRTYCSANATDTVCAAPPYYVYAREDLNSLTLLLQNASLWGAKVDHTDTSCIGGGSTCGGGIFLRSP